MFSRDKKIESYYLENFDKKIFFLKVYSYFFSSLAKTLKLMINKSNNFLFIGICQYPLIDKVDFKKITILEISKKYFDKYKEINDNSSIEYLDKKETNENTLYDKILISSLESEKNPLLFLKTLRKNITDDGRVFILKYNLWWTPIIKIFSLLKLRVSHPYQNVISSYFLKNMCEQSDFEIIHKENQILLPINIPILSFIFNKILAKIPILNFFCFIHIFVLRPVEKKASLDDYKISIIVPCKNEEKNIEQVVNSIPLVGKKIQVLFGDDKSTDNTLAEIKKYLKKTDQLDIDYYNAPGVCKSENIYTGFEKADGDIIAILDADNTVNGEELTNFFELLVTKRYDFINGTRFIYPMTSNAMRKMNFIGNLLFSYLFSSLLDIRVTDTLCGTKVFYKKDWKKIKEYVGTWGTKDMWGDYDLLIGAKKNYLKIGENPVYYDDRIYGESKMTNVLKNAARMLKIIIISFLKLRKI